MSERGFTLPELLMAALLTLAAVVTAVAFVEAARAAFQRDSASADLAQRLRSGLETLVTDVRGAGAGADVASTGALVDSIPVVTPLPSLDGAASTDGLFHAITIITVPADAAQGVLREPLLSAADPLRLIPPPACPAATPACGFTVSATGLVFDAAGAYDIFEVDAVDALSVSVQPATLVSTLYAAGAVVAEADVVSYGLSADGAGGQRLTKVTGAGARAPVLDHVVAFDVEVYGEAAPPLPPTDPGSPPSYGPVPPSPGVDDPRDGWGPGENCTTALDPEGARVARLPWLAQAGTLVRITPDGLDDGPWCPGLGGGADYDADLLRVRRVDLRLRLEVASAKLRGPAGRLFLRAGQGGRAVSWVPDGEWRVTVVPRNLVRR